MENSTSATVIAPGITGFTSQVRPGIGVLMDTRSLAIELDDGSVLLHSPSALTPADEEHIEQLGDVQHIVAPNLFHHLGLPAAIKRWPAARLWAPRGITDKRPELSHHGLLDLASSEGRTWPSALERYAVRGMPKFREWAFLHRPTGTLIVTDLLFNRPIGHGLSSRVLLTLTGAAKECNVSRLFQTLIRDKAAFGQSCRRILGLDFERVVMAHGEVLERDAKAQVAAALARWTSVPAR